MFKKKFIFWAKEYFTFSSSERKGIVVLIFLITLTLLLRIFLPKINREEDVPVDVSNFKQEIARFEKSQDSIQSKKEFATYKKDSLKTTHLASQPTIFKIEINTSDSSMLERLPGIGSVFSKRIIKYRNMLGGYYSTSQISEVYGITSQTTEKIKKHLLIDTLKVTKIPVNSADFKKINAHPYISFDQTKLICKLRSKTKIENIEQLVNANIFTLDEIKKVSPYLSFE